jgi:hypothetical protein
MHLTETEWHVLRNLHGNAIPARDLRARLRGAGLRYCDGCDSVRAVSDFSPNGPGRLQLRCRACSRVRRRRNTAPVGGLARDAWRSRQYRMRHLERERARHRERYAARRAAGLTAHEANYR